MAVIEVLRVVQFGIESRVAPYTAADRPVVRSRPQQVITYLLTYCFICRTHTL